MKTNDRQIDCRTCRERLAELLLDDAYTVEQQEFAAHMKGCEGCSAEWAELRATFALLDAWAAPEPTPYFDAKMQVLLREELAAPPAGMWERMRSYMMFSTGRAMRPLMAGALALLMVAGGGGVVLGVYQQQTPVASSPAVNDLKILDRNAQALQQMDQLLDEPAGGDEGMAPPTT